MTKHIPRSYLLGALWLMFAGFSFLFCMFVYASVQQDERQSANDPQIQLAEDTAAALENGVPVAQVVPQSNVVIATSLAPWVAVYDNSGTPITSSGTLNDAPPSLPSGVFDTSNAHAWVDGPLWSDANEIRFTWQPQEGVRQAVVLVHLTGTTQGFVASGRSLREVEIRERKQTIFTFGAFIAALILSTILTWVAARLTSHNH